MKFRNKKYFLYDIILLKFYRSLVYLITSMGNNGMKYCPELNLLHFATISQILSIRILYFQYDDNVFEILVIHLIYF